MYEAFKKKLLADFEEQRDMIVAEEARSLPETLFEIRSKDDEIYAKIIEAFERSTWISAEKLLIDIFRKYDIPATPASQSEIWDICFIIDGEERRIIIKSSPLAFNAARLDFLKRYSEDTDIPTFVVFLLKDSLESRKTLQRFNLRFENYRNKVTGIIFEDFLELLFGHEEREAFEISMAGFKDEFRQAIGYQLTEVCSPYNMEKFKKKLASTIPDFPYEVIRNKHSSEFAKSRLISDRDFEIIKNSYINGKKYLMLLSGSDFSESFLTSEWLYEKYVTNDSLDNTYIVSGYLKSIEQLLWNIILLKCEGRKIKDIEISASSKDEIDNTLGLLERFISRWDNLDIFMDELGESRKSVQKYIIAHIANWRRQYRNGYFHKHILKEKANTDSIREDTLYIYLLLLGSIYCDDDIGNIAY